MQLKNVIRIVSTFLITIIYLFMKSGNDITLAQTTSDPRFVQMLEGIVWLVLTLIINAMTSKDPRTYFQQRMVLILFICLFVYYFGTALFPGELFTIANLEAYWSAFLLMTLSGYIMKVRKIESPLAEENYDIVIYYLWMMQFVFFIGFPALFFGPVVGVIVGPILFFSVVIYTNKKKENQTKTPYISLDTKNSDNTSGNLQETRKSEYSE